MLNCNEKLSFPEREKKRKKRDERDYELWSNFEMAEKKRWGK